MKLKARITAPFRPRAVFSTAPLTACVAPIAGCARHGAPTFTFAGSYFPAWMACAFAGILVALALRIVLGRLRIDQFIAFRLTFYAGVAISAGVAVWLLNFGY